MPYNHPMRLSPGGQLLWEALRSRIMGAGVVRPLSSAAIASRCAA